MFTGIIEATGIINSLDQTGADLHAVISAEKLDFSDIKKGDSICVNGVCLTATAIKGHTLSVDISNETISLTSFYLLKEGDRVNLEKAMQAASRFGGHIVSGHVDGLAELVDRTTDGRSERLRFTVTDKLIKYIVVKGSVCLDGISLTVNDVAGNQFGINIIPHTAQQTTFGDLEPGGKVNLEVDIISRYLESLLSERQNGSELTGVTLDKLVRCGFAESSANKK